MSKIILIAFTNHALDHLLCNILDAGITTKIARLGSRHSAHERIVPYLLDDLEKRSDENLHYWDKVDTRRQLGRVAEQFSRITATLNGTAIDESMVTTWLEQHQPGHNSRLHDPPKWVQKHYTESKGWKTAGNKARDESIRTSYGLWVKGVDLDFLDPPVATLPPQQPDPPPARPSQNSRRTNKKKSSTSSRETTYRNYLVEWFSKNGIDKPPPIPQGNRTLDLLLCDYDVWNMSKCERSTLCKHWESETRAYNHQSNVETFNDLSQKHAKLQMDLDAYNTEVTSVPSSRVSHYTHFMYRLDWKYCKN